MNRPLPVLQVDALAKRFCRDTARSLRYGIADILHDLLPDRPGELQLRKGEFWALEDVSFSVMPGEAVAIGGHNGAGKTTLLRVLAGLLKPDCGQMRLSGSVNPVIELGQGLHPMLTGRENAEIGLAWRCCDQAAIADGITRVAQFADLDTMFDTPVHSYSTGMRLRLAFAIAVAAPCDLLLLDEVLAVGDIAFQRKCIEHMRRHMDRGGALILVSHNPVQMQALCRRGILLDRGKLVFDGQIENCIDRMFELQQPRGEDLAIASGSHGPAQITGISIRGARDDDAIAMGEAAIVEFAFTVLEPVSMRCAVSIWTRDLSQCIAYFVEPDFAEAAPGEQQRRCHIPDMPLFHGTYCIRLIIFDPDTHLAIATYGYNSAPMEFRVTDALSRTSVLARHTGQLVSIEHEWFVDSRQNDS